MKSLLVCSFCVLFGLYSDYALWWGTAAGLWFANFLVRFIDKRVAP